MYQTFAHTADVGLRVEAADLEGLFADAGRGFFSLIVSNLGEVEARARKEFKIDGSDLTFLLVDWLNELLFTYESERLLFREFDVSIGPGGLTAIAAGDTVDEARHRLDHEVKAITYHGLKVEPTSDGWTAEVVLDI